MLRTESANESASNIPNIFHLFWAGSKMPDHAIYNLYSFLNNLPAGGKVHFWVTDPNCLNKSNLFKRLDIDLITPEGTHHDMSEEIKGSPVKIEQESRLVIKDIRELLNSTIFDELDELNELNESKGHGLSEGYSFQTIKQIIERELVGKGNPVVAKDCFIPLCLYKEGGYYFDLDYEAVEELTPPQAKFGILLNAAGINPSCFASEKESRFLVFALLHLIKNYETVPDLIEAYTKKKSSPHTSTEFLNLDVFRDRSNPLRSSLTCLTSGAILHPALKDYARSLDLECDAEFLKAVNFASQPENAFLLTMGVKHLKPEELTYKKSKQPEASSITKCFQALFCCGTKGKKTASTPAEDKVENWRNKKAPNRSFEAEDILKPPQRRK